MPRSKNRPRWPELPQAVRERVNRLVGGTVVAAVNCPGGFSPGFASRLVLDDGRRVFVKAIATDAGDWQAQIYRTEASVAANLPATVPAPQLLGTYDDDGWVMLAYEDIDGHEPDPWSPADLARVLTTLDTLWTLPTEPAILPTDHPRLGGWSEVAADPSGPAELATQSAWAARRLADLVQLETDGLVAARGTTIVHFDLYPHNILLSPHRVVFVDWPHARLGAPVVDLVSVLASAAADGLDPEPVLRHPSNIARRFDPHVLNAVAAALAGFCFAGALPAPAPGASPVADSKLRLGLATVNWLRRRLG
jgi:hypothetical protein